MRALGLILPILFSIPLAAQDRVVSSDFESDRSLRPAFSVETKNCLIDQPVYDSLSAILERTKELQTARSQPEEALQLSEQIVQFHEQLDGLSAIIHFKDSDDAIQKLRFRMTNSRFDFHIQEKESNEWILSEDPRALVLMESFLSLVEMSRLDRYEGLLLARSRVGELSSRFPDQFLERKNINLEASPETELEVLLQFEGQELKFDLSKSVFGWMHRLDESQSHLPHRSAKELCIRFACDDRNLLISSSDPVLKEARKLFSDFARQTDQLRRDFYAVMRSKETSSTTSEDTEN